jgi:pimeloyl-ACP methyl ester carboxylesterase
VAGTHLAYETIGVGPCVVLIHGFTLDADIWDDQVEALAQQRRVVRYDMRGFGRSALPDGTNYTPAGDLKALLEYLRIDRAAIVGLSLGGGVALDFAVGYPEATSALILVDAMVDGWDWSAEWNEQARAVWAAARQSGIAAAKERWLAHPLFRPGRQKPEITCRLERMVDNYSGWHWRNKDSQQPAQPPTVQRLGDITAPTLVVVGEEDVVDFRAMADLFARDIPRSRKVTMPGVGHMPNLEDPERFNAIVGDFLDQGERAI